MDLKIFLTKHKLLIFVLLMATVIRFAGLTDWSPPLNRDEAALGYNAYSLLLTGRDEHGTLWPLAFESIGDYKMPGYIYLSILPVAVFGLNAFAIKFWSAFAGVLTVWGIWLLAGNIGIILKVKDRDLAWLQFLAGFLLAILPWHIHYSRIGFEANVALSLVIWATVMLFKTFRSGRLRWLHYAVGFLILAQLTYSSVFVFLPFWALGALILLRGKLKLKDIIFPVLLLILGSSLAFGAVLTVSSAKQAITVFSDPEYLDVYAKARTLTMEQSPLVAKVWMNKYAYFGRVVFGNYLPSFMPGFLFFNAIEHPWHAVTGHGFFYLLDGIFVLTGLVGGLNLYRSRKVSRKIILFWGLWVLAAPVASATTTDAPHATRTLMLVPAWVLLVVLGVWSVAKLVPNKFKFVFWGIIMVYGLLFARFSYIYVTKYPKSYAKSLYSGIEMPIKYLQDQKGEVYFPEVSDSVYLYVLVYNQIDPLSVQRDALWKGADTARLSHIEHLGRYHFATNVDPKLPANYWVLREDIAPAGFELERAFEDEDTGKMWYVYRR